MGSTASTAAAPRRSATLFEDDHLRIRFVEGKSNEAIISFAGVGTGDYRIHNLNQPSRGGEQYATQIDEFRKTLGETRNVYYVADKRRGWYNGLEDRIRDVINSHIAERKTRHVLALGNSMGGSAALMLASGIRGCRQAVAFAPQSSVYPEFAPFETRWEAYRLGIRNWTTPDPILSMDASMRRYYVFYGMRDDLDKQHIQRILARRLPNTVVFGLRKGSHDVALYLRNNGVSLKDIIDAAFTGTANDVRAVIKALPYLVRAPGAPPPDPRRKRRARPRA